MLILNEYVVFNRFVCIDLMKVGGSSVVHAMDCDTKFDADCLSRSESSVDV